MIGMGTPGFECGQRRHGRRLGLGQGNRGCCIGRRGGISGRIGRRGGDSLAATL